MKNQVEKSKERPGMWVVVDSSKGKRRRSTGLLARTKESAQHYADLLNAWVNKLKPE